MGKAELDAKLLRLFLCVAWFITGLAVPAILFILIIHKIETECVRKDDIHIVTPAQLNSGMELEKGDLYIVVEEQPITQFYATENGVSTSFEEIK